MRRQVGRPKLRRVDRALLTAAARHLPPASRLSFLVTPAIVELWQAVWASFGLFLAHNP
jgi:hypothetical protein